MGRWGQVWAGEAKIRRQYHLWRCLSVPARGHGRGGKGASVLALRGQSWDGLPEEGTGLGGQGHEWGETSGLSLTCLAAAARIQVAMSAQQEALAVGSTVIQAGHQVQGGLHEDRGLLTLPARKGP